VKGGNKFDTSRVSVEWGSEVYVNAAEAEMLPPVGEATIEEARRLDREIEQELAEAAPESPLV
jgi:hypothetical protein